MVPNVPAGPRWNRPRRAVRLAFLAVLFGGLASLEVVDGFEQLARQRAQHRTELLDLVERQQAILARRLSDLLGDATRHAGHLARTPGVRDLLRGDDPGAAVELARWTLPYLASFTEIDRLSLLGADGRERFRCERMGGGVGALPAGLLETSASPVLAELAARAADGAVAVSELVYDGTRVEVAESDRRVFHLLCAVEDGPRRLGSVVVTIYAAPLLRALTEFEPLPGATSCVMNDDGEIVAPVAPGATGATGAAPPQVARWLLEDAELRESLRSGAERVERSGATFFARRNGPDPAAHLVTAISEADLRASSTGTGVLRTGLRTVLVLAAISLGSAFTVRASLREDRLHETESYLARIREESAKHRALMEAAADIILLVDTTTDRVADWNPRAREAIEGLAQPGSTHVRELERAFGAEGLARLRAGLTAAAAKVGEPHVVAGLELASADGTRLAVDARCIGLDYGGRRTVEVALSDRTRERASELRARIAERLSALGLLTAGVAHEINNPLEGIGNYLSLLERPGLEDERRAHYFAQVRRGFDRIGDIAGQLLRSARQGTARPDRASGDAGAVDLVEVVERASSMASLSGELHGVELVRAGLERPVAVAGNAGQLEQVLLNLFLNAGRAMDGRGRIHVTLDLTDPAWAELHVEDRGPGIAAEDLSRIFDPFFTRSGGTGLGLSVSYGIASALGGELSAANVPEGGARFTLRLPRQARGGNDETAG